MTRENKLALVIGFGLILLVGILISDHFSAARRQESAQLARTIEPLSRARWEDPNLIALNPDSVDAIEQTPGEPPYPHAPISRQSGPSAPNGGQVIDPMAAEPMEAVMMGGEAGRGVGLDPRQVSALPYRFHDVRGGESLSSICQHCYGDASLAKELARYNEIADPNSIRTGHRLRIPDAADLVRGRARPPTVPGDQRIQPPLRQRTYTVRKDDNLSKIARRLLGSGTKYWAIYEHNRDVLASPDDLRPGMVLKIPDIER